MAKALEEITKEAIQLPRSQRIALAGLLLELEDYPDDPEAEAAWERELLARIKAIDEGTATGVSYEEVMNEAEKRFIR
jgi:putative addiction module component (TIGR02574 family)